MARGGLLDVAIDGMPWQSLEDDACMQCVLLGRWVPPANDTLQPHTLRVSYRGDSNEQGLVVNATCASSSRLISQHSSHYVI